MTALVKFLSVRLAQRRKRMIVPAYLIFCKLVAINAFGKPVVFWIYRDKGVSVWKRKVRVSTALGATVVAGRILALI